MTTRTARAPVRLGLADDPFAAAEPAPWIRPLLELGRRASRYADTHAGRQLVVAVSVPRRDFAAVLVACGWILARPAVAPRPVMEVMRELEPGALVRIVTEREVILDRFTRLDESITPPRFHLTGSHWYCARIRAVAAAQNVADKDLPVRMTRPSVGKLGGLAPADTTWCARLAAPEADLAIVGTRAWLSDDLDAFPSVDSTDPPSAGARADDAAKAHERGGTYKTGFGAGSLKDVVLPDSSKSSTAFSEIHASARLAERLPLSRTLRGVVLDGNLAIKYLAEIETSFVGCIIDRSVADETGAELIVQMRNTRGEPVSVKEDLGWRPPAGVEVLAFTVAL